VGDFNNDTFLDFVESGVFSGLTVRLGDGTGQFTFQGFQAGSQPRSVAVGDFNDDTFIDIVVANFNQEKVSVLRGDGTGEFSNPTSFPAGDRPVSIAVGDFNEDAIDDLAVANELSQNFSILFGVPSDFLEFQTPLGEFSALVQNLDGTFIRTMKDGTKIHFDTNGLHTSTVDRNGNITSYAYNGEGRLITKTDPARLVTTFNYGKITVSL